MHTLKSFFFYFVDFRVDFIMHHANIYICIYTQTHTYGITVLYVCHIAYIKITERVKNGNILFG